MNVVYHMVHKKGHKSVFATDESNQMLYLASDLIGLFTKVMPQ